MKNRIKYMLLAFLMMFIAGAAVLGTEDAYAAEAGTVTITNIDYDRLTMKIDKNGNGIVFYSVDQKATWKEVEGIAYDDGGKYYLEMDISWISASAETQIYFKGNVNTNVISVSVPKANSSFKVKYDKVDVSFDFSGNDGATEFMWRKSTDYNWNKVSFDVTSSSYKNFISTVDGLRFKGCKLIFRIGQVMGTGAENPGERPSKDVTVSIPKMAAAPSLKVNVKKMTVNTKTTLEYYDATAGKWVACEKNMKVEDIAPAALYENGGANVSIRVRVAATEKKPYSQTGLLSVTGQCAAPVVGTDVKHEQNSEDGKYYITFPRASKSNPYEYCLVKAGDTFDASTAKWKAVKANTKIVKYTEKAAPEGSLVYVRYAGITENVSKGIELKLPSQPVSFGIAWQKNDGTTK